MFRLLLNMLIIIVIVLILNNIVRNVITDYTWGTRNIHLKTEYFDDNKSEYNTVFIGSSTVHRHIIPSLFDEEVNNISNLNVSSFNLGTGRFAPPESYIYYENLINMDSNNIKYVIIELRNIFRILDENLHSTRANYWYTPNSYIFTINAILDEKVSEKKEYKEQKLRNHTISFLENIFNFGLIKAIYRANQKREVSFLQWQEIIGRNFDGYKPYIVGDEGGGKKRKLRKDSASIERKVRQMENKFNKYSQNTPSCNQTHIKKIKQLIALSKKRGIHLIFFLSPKITIGIYDELIPLYMEIDDNHKIEMANSVLYPEHYSIEYAYDNSHLNFDGAKILTKHTARQFVNIINNSKDKN